MMKREAFPVANIYVPTARRKTLDPKRVEALAQSMLTDGQQTPILVREDGARFVLVEGLHRLEAAKALGETTIIGFRVAARKH
jgi:sulfiredoxin